MVTNWTLREMEVADLEQVIQIEKTSFPDPWTIQTFYDECICNSAAYYFVLISPRNQILGYGGFWLVLDEAQITKIAVHPKFRRKGYGENLLNHFMHVARKLGAKIMTLEVRASNQKAQLLYHKLGFAWTGIRPRFYQVDPEDAIIMWVNLDEKTNCTRY